MPCNQFCPVLSCSTQLQSRAQDLVCSLHYPYSLQHVGCLWPHMLQPRAPRVAALWLCDHQRVNSSGMVSVLDLTDYLQKRVLAFLPPFWRVRDMYLGAVWQVLWWQLPCQ